MDLKNKKVIITGGGSGIGEAIAKLFAQKGASVHLFELNQPGSKLVVDSIEANGGKAVGHYCDVTDQEQVMSLIKEINDAQPIDILVNNAGVAHIGTVENTSEEDFDHLFQVNVKGYYNCMHAVVPFMKKNGGGVILNMASIAGSIAVGERFAYSMTKGAVLAMTYSVAKDFLKFNIRCNSISPARIHTPFVDNYVKKTYPGKETKIFKELSDSQPMGRMGTPEEVADLALFLCSDKAGFITGNDYLIDGGYVKLNG